MASMLAAALAAANAETGINGVNNINGYQHPQPHGASSYNGEAAQ
jgi:hypothetical protein